MRGILLAMLVAAGIGLVGSAGVSAAPINGAAIGNAADATSPVETVQHWRWGSGRPLALGFGRSLALGQPWPGPSLPSVRGAAAGGGADRRRRLSEMRSRSPAWVAGLFVTRPRASPRATPPR